MAIEHVLLRNRQTQEERRVPAASARFFPDYDLVAETGAEPPKKNASTDEWRSYVVEHGFADEETAAPLGRDELIALVPTTTTEEN